MSQLAVIAKLTAQDGKRADLVSAMKPMLEHVEANEAGTLTYMLLEDAGDENCVWVYEMYADQASFDAHSESDAMKALGGTLAGLLAGRPELTFAWPVGGKGLPSS